MSLHGGYETVPDLLTPEFVSNLCDNVSKWLYLAKKNIEFLPPKARTGKNFLHSFNAVPAYAGKWIDRAAFRQEHGIPRDAFVFVQCSRAVEAKGWRTSIRIVEQLSAAARRPRHLVLIGDGPAAAELREEYAHSPFVTFLGQVDTPVRYFKCCDMGLFPSTFSGETFPLFLLECFSVGLPVATTDIGEIPRLMEGFDGRQPGIMIDYRRPPQDLVASFVAQLRKLLVNSEGYDECVKAAHATFNRFNMDTLAVFYQGVFAEGQRPSSIA